MSFLLKIIKSKSFYLLFLVIGFCMSCSDDNPESTSVNQFTDPRDGQVYSIITIGTQTWFAENLKYDIGDATSVCYDDVSSNCFTYGRLYEGVAAQTACPEGWHLPSIDEWQTLFDYLGGTEVAHVFVAPFGEQQGEEIGFNLLAAGRYFASFKDVTTHGYYYTSTDGGLPNSYKYLTFKPEEFVSLNATASSNIKQSCRCVKD